MQVRYDEGLAIHIGPEPCVGIREGASEASVGERVGQPLSREIKLEPDADAVCWVEGNTVACIIASALSVRRGLRPWHACKLLVWKPGDLSSTLSVATPLGRIGKARSRSR